MSTDTTVVTARRLPLDGTYNVRDLGGYQTLNGGTTRWRTVFRADSLHRLTPDGQAHLLDAGLRTVIDLRRDAELQDAPNVLAQSGRVRYVWVSLSPNPAAPEASAARRELTADSLSRAYRAMIHERQAELREIMSTLAQPGALPALVHCTAGKDRTGIVSALLLALAGVDHDTIAQDYALTATYLTDAYFADARGRAEAAGYAWEQYRLLLGCPADLMLATLADIDERFGGVDAYLRQIGVTAAEVESLRAALVEGR